MKTRITGCVYVETYRETLFDKVRCPIIVSQGREILGGQVRDTRGLEDDIIQEKEENEREPGGCLFRVDIRSWILYGTCVGFGIGYRIIGSRRTLGSNGTY